MKMRKTLTVLGFAIAASAGPLAAPTAALAEPEIYTGILNNTAVGGYDPVAYFTQGRPVRGSAEHSTSYRGATWRFASAENLARFRANPAAYAPQYGGYCAWAVSQGYTAKGDPRYWKIVGGKLYLNYDATIQRRWEADIPGFIRLANANWPRVIR